MKKNISLLILLITILFLPQTSRAVELITNGGFETGTFAGWTTVDVTTNVWFNWRVTGVSSSASIDSWTRPTSPHTGSFSAWNGWAAGNPVPDAYRLRQNVTIPNNPTELIRLRWWDRLQWNLAFQAGSVLPQHMIVNVLNPSNNAVIQEVYRFTAPAASQGPINLLPGQGWNQRLVNLSAYKGQTIRLEFLCTVAQNTMGPGICEFDDISVQNFVPTAATVPVGGRVVSADGRGIGYVSVTLTDSQGGIRTARTSPFGYYRFDDVEVGRTYIISVASKTYSFSQSSQIITVVEETGEMNFNADN